MKGVTNKDIEAIILAKKLNVSNFALSFANNKKDVVAFRNLIGRKSNLILSLQAKHG